MNNFASTRFPIDSTLAARWSPRSFSSRSVDLSVLGSLLEAARWAPSSYNEQPWAFLVATQAEPTEFAKMLDCLVEGNQKWAKEAPVLVISVAKLAFERNGQPNRHALHDVGAATENLIIQAVTMGLAVHPMAGFLHEKARAAYDIPHGWEPAAAIAVGYPGDQEPGARSRKPLESFVFRGKWGQSLL